MTAIRSILMTFTAAIALAGCQSEPQKAAQSGTVVTSGKADIGGPFTLVNQDGITVTDLDILGKPQLIYFGFSYCPDVCPLALQNMGAALYKVDPKAEVYTPIFISVDPERDTPESLKVYISANGFPENLMGLTGTLDQVETAKSAYKIFSQKVYDDESAADYLVDHASLIFLMDPQGEFVDVFSHTTAVNELIERLSTYQKSL